MARKAKGKGSKRTGPTRKEIYAKAVQVKKKQCPAIWKMKKAQLSAFVSKHKGHGSTPAHAAAAPPAPAAAKKAKRRIVPVQVATGQPAMAAFAGGTQLTPGQKHYSKTLQAIEQKAKNTNDASLAW